MAKTKQIIVMTGASGGVGVQIPRGFLCFQRLKITRS